MTSSVRWRRPIGLLFLLYGFCLVATIVTGSVRKTADDLKTPVCDTDRNCVIGGVCRPDSTGKKRCMCSTSCLMTVPVSCATNNAGACVTMGATYTRKYNTSQPYCHHRRCVCPPQYDEVPAKPHTDGFPFMPPMKCDRRELDIMLTISPARSVFKGTEATIYCCVNLDPREYVPEEAVFFVQNGTRRRDASTTPYAMFSPKDDSLFTVPTCWSLTLQNVQPSDAGTYSCIAQPMGISAKELNETLNFEVKTPRMITNVKVETNATEAKMIWDMQDGIKIDLHFRLVYREGRKEIWKGKNVKSPVQITGLSPATAYEVFIRVADGENPPFNLTHHFETIEGQPGTPIAEDIRLIQTVNGLQCEVEWRAPRTPNGKIQRYFIQLSGKLRYTPDSKDASTFPIDHPPPIHPCTVVNETTSAVTVEGRSFFACSYGPLKPNRNYTATIWAENAAGLSLPLVYHENCAMDYAQPDSIDPPELVVTHNVSSFDLRFSKPPSDENGPIACYYMAIVPLLSNVSVLALPKPEDIVMDSYEKAMQNNVRNAQSGADTAGYYYAYIAESYMQFPDVTTIGDAKIPAGIEPCNVFYLSRFKAQDPPLKTDLKYTGFLIVRVDRDKTLLAAQQASRGLALRPRSRFARQMSNSDPAYAFSTFFKPIYLAEASSASSAFQVFFVIMICLIALVGFAGSVLYFLYKKGIIRQLCPVKKDHDILRQSFAPIAVEDLVQEFVIRHRDSDFLFTTEFEALPKPRLDYSTCDRKENIKKNRYTDIRCGEETRVHLKVPRPDGSDYINANYIRGYNDKKVFIAAQAPVEHSINDFWQMIWEQDVKILIMVANTNERGRRQVDKYWPNQEEDPTLINEVYEVVCVSTEQFADYIKREFEIRCGTLPSKSNTNGVESDYANVPALRPASKADSNFGSSLLISEIRRITHYHFTNWNDLKAPDTTYGIMRLMLQLRKTEEYNNSPVLIHCSAGVGRTGTFIAVDSLLDQCLAEGKADVFNTVANIRKQRNASMVQAQEQYVFIYRALAEYFLFGDTDIPGEYFIEQLARLKHAPRERRVSGSSSVKLVNSHAVSYDFNGASSSPPPTTSGMPAVMPPTAGHVSGNSIPNKLWQWRNAFPNKDTKVSGIEAEYSKLFASLDPPKGTSIAHNDENIPKNRNLDAVVYDRHRVLLYPRIGVGTSSQYINATPYKGHIQPWILAQDPLDLETCHEFWRMIDDNRVHTIVMLSRDDDFAPQEKYWPETSGVNLVLGTGDDLTITLVSERPLSGVVERRLKYHFKREPDPIDVVQYAFTGWPTGAATPTSTAHLRELAQRVLTRAAAFPEVAPIVVHSRDGSFEPGVFVALGALLERYASEKMIDVFRTARQVHQHRPLVFPKMEQYIFLYDAMADYLRSIHAA
uniref:protein-tyrosine-phosphatase n=1 Tax=Panagrellus redivivus TaxID=6233 RepID=A0A7E4V8E7_PANRE